jgi:2-haloacid dehalogenase
VADRWATFDCYGTLIDWEDGLRGAFAELWPQQDPDRLADHYHAVEPRIQLAGELPYREVLARALEAVAAIESLELDPSGRSALADSLPSWPAFPEVPGALERLRGAGWRLAILSNTDPDLLAASIRSLGVEIDLAVTAADAGSYKPAPGHWQYFLAETGAERAEQVHVAASLFHDIEPAARLGLRAVWVNRLREESDLPREAEIPDLSRLPAILERLSR